MLEWVARYLSLLGVSSVKSPTPSLELLGRLSQAQITRVPFENVTAILRRVSAGDGPVPEVDTDAMLATWEARAGGGVCFDAATMFRRLLAELGYTTRPTLAQISFPGSHHASIVSLEGVEYLVDVANGAPFFEPIPLDRETIVRRAGLAWRFRRETLDTVIQDRLIEGSWQPLCRYSVASADACDRDIAYQRHHLVGETWVLGSLTLVRCGEDDVVRLRDDQLVRYSPDGTRSETVSRTDLPRIVAEVFGLPALPITAACAALDSLSVAPPGA